ITHDPHLKRRGAIGIRSTQVWSVCGWRRRVAKTVVLCISQDADDLDVPCCFWRITKLPPDRILAAEILLDDGFIDNDDLRRLRLRVANVEVAPTKDRNLQRLEEFGRYVQHPQPQPSCETRRFALKMHGGRAHTATQQRPAGVAHGLNSWSRLELML